MCIIMQTLHNIPLVAPRSSYDQNHDTREHVSHDSDPTPPTTRALSQHASRHVHEARAHDITVSHGTSHECEWRHAADTDAASATAASSGARVSHRNIHRRRVVFGGSRK